MSSAMSSKPRREKAQKRKQEKFMGSSQSTRTLTVSNENENNVIRVSDNVVRRLRGEAIAAVEEANQSRAAETGQTTPQSAFSPGYSPISSIQVRREVQAAREDTDKVWQKRVNSMVEGQERSKQILEGEFRKALNEVQIAFKGYNTERYENPCIDIEAKLTKCYSEHSSQPLNCASEVRAFSECVQVKHSNMLKART